ncbi:Actin-regulating kinase PRK1 [Yarrowia sp. C11]|nr:Actin-regulating kinase PRK1 [Yarrowia sp. C11]KAG5370556.1 Actin-regulating kinase PRK1 [Yarrowia sp. E02]
MTHKEAPPGAYPPGTQLTVGSHAVTIKKYISEGGFAHVYTCDISPEFRGSSVACLKRVAVPDKPSLNLLRCEVDAMKRLAGNEYIVQYIDSHAARNANGPGYEVFLLMEYCSRNGLIDFMNERLRERLSEPEVLTIGSNIAEAVFCMHYLDQPLLHRDLKIENVLISGDGKFKLCDFGSVSPVLRPPRNQMEFRILDDDIQRHTTVQYRAPEMIDIMRGFPIDEKSDIWALGVFFYKLCYYITPFEQQGQLAVLNAQFSFPQQPHYSDGLKHLISVLLREDPRNRPNVYQTIQELCRLRNVPVPDHITQTYYKRKEERRLALEQAALMAPGGVPQPSSSVLPSPPVQPSPPLLPQQGAAVAGAGAGPVPVQASSQLEVPSHHSRNASQSSLEAFDPDEAAARYPTVEEITRSLESNNLWDMPPSRGVSEHASARATRDNSYDISRGSVPPSAAPAAAPAAPAAPVAVPSLPAPQAVNSPQLSPQTAPATLATNNNSTAPVNIPAFKAKSASPPVQSYKSNNPYLEEATAKYSAAASAESSSHLPGASSDSSDDGGYYQPKVDRSYRDEFGSATSAPAPMAVPVATAAASKPLKPLPQIPVQSPAANAMPPPRKPARPNSLYMRQNSSRASIISEHGEDMPQIQYSDYSGTAPTVATGKPLNDHDELQAILTGLSEHETTVVLDDRTNHHIDSSVDFLQDQQQREGGSSWKLFRSLSSGSKQDLSAPSGSDHRRRRSIKMLHRHHRHKRESQEYGGNTDTDEDSEDEQLPSMERSLNLNVPKRNNRWSKSFESLSKQEGVSDDEDQPERRSRRSMDERHSRHDNHTTSRSRDGGRKSLDAQRFEMRQEELRAHAKANAANPAAQAAAQAASKASTSPPVARKSLDLSRVESRVDDDSGSSRSREREPHKHKRFSRSGSIQGRIHALINRRPSPPRKTASGYGKYTESESDGTSDEVTLAPTKSMPARANTAPARNAAAIRVSTDDRAPPPRPSPKPVHLQSPKLSTAPDKPDLPPRKPTRVMTEDDDWKASFNEKYPSLG